MAAHKSGRTTELSTATRIVAGSQEAAARSPVPDMVSTELTIPLVVATDNRPAAQASRRRACPSAPSPHCSVRAHESNAAERELSFDRRRCCCDHQRGNDAPHDLHIIWLHHDRRHEGGSFAVIDVAATPDPAYIFTMTIVTSRHRRKRTRRAGTGRRDQSAPDRPADAEGQGVGGLWPSSRGMVWWRS